MIWETVITDPMTWEELVADPKLYAFSKKWACWPGAPRIRPNTGGPLSWGELAPMIGQRAQFATGLYEREHGPENTRFTWKRRHEQLKRGVKLAEQMVELWGDDAFVGEMIEQRLKKKLVGLPPEHFRAAIEGLDGDMEADRERHRQVHDEIAAQLALFERRLPDLKKQQKRFSSAKVRGTHQLFRCAIEIWTELLQQTLGDETPRALMELFGGLRKLAGCKEVDPPELYRLIREHERYRLIPESRQ
jgi:hypothetical protein